MYYFMITVSAFLFSLQFMFNHGYQKENGSSWPFSLKFSLYTSITGFVILLVINQFQMKITMFSLLIAFLYGAVSISLSYSSIKAFEYANLSVYSVFSMIGGMILPFIYGILCGEKCNAVKLICCILIAISVMMTINKGKQLRKAFKYYMAVFFLNGMVGVISKFHQSYTALCVDSASFIMLTKLTTILLSTLIMLTLHERNFTINKKAFLYCAGYSVFNSVGNLMLLIALLYLPASVQYPIVTGGVIVFSTLIDIVRKVHVTKKELLSAIIAFISAILMAF